MDRTHQSARNRIDRTQLFIALLLLATSTEGAGLDQAVSIYLKNPKYVLTMGPNAVPYQVKAPVSFGRIVYANGAIMHAFPDKSGRFVFDNLEPGKWELLFDTPRGYRGVTAVTGSKVAIVNGVQVVSVSLQAGAQSGSVSIEITGKKGRIVGKVTQASASR